LPSLKALQQAFTESLLAKDGLRPPLLSQQLDQLSCERLSIYCNNRRLTLKDSLADTFPVLKRLVGDDFFNAMSSRYIYDYPARSRQLEDFGDKMPIFISEFPPVAKLVYLEDVARLEWAWHKALSGPKPLTFPFQAFQELPQSSYEHLLFTLPIRSTLISSPYPILAIWDANQPEEKEPPIIELDAGDDHLMVIPTGRHASIVRLSETEMTILKAIENSIVFRDICTELLNATNEKAFLDLIKRNLIGEFDVKSSH